ncbi:MAG: hypothetical protein II134_03700, partial [Lachnospiraceae bacterium]|nr:hypothetical protein [Lachnospiraceae bacterium]
LKFKPFVAVFPQQRLLYPPSQTPLSHPKTKQGPPVTGSPCGFQIKRFSERFQTISIAFNQLQACNPYC